MARKTNIQGSKMTIARAREESLSSLICPAYLACMDRILYSNFFTKLDHNMPNTGNVMNIRVLVWTIWSKYKYHELDITHEQIMEESCLIFDKTGFDKLRQEYEEDLEDFIDIIQNFVVTARKRLIILQRCNFWDRLGLKWEIFRRDLTELARKEKTPVNLPRLLDEHQSLLCSIIVKRLGGKENK